MCVKNEKCSSPSPSPLQSQSSLTAVHITTFNSFARSLLSAVSQLELYCQSIANLVQGGGQLPLPPPPPPPPPLPAPTSYFASFLQRPVMLLDFHHQWEVKSPICSQACGREINEIETMWHGQDQISPPRMTGIKQTSPEDQIARSLTAHTRLNVLQWTKSFLSLFTFNFLFKNSHDTHTHTLNTDVIHYSLET